MTTRCPVCDQDGWTRRCACGYDFAERDPEVAIARLREQQSFGRRTGLAGLALLVATPLTAMLGLGTAVDVLVFLQGVLGVTLTIAGLSIGAGPRKQLRAAQALRQLPVARVVSRPDVDAHPQADR